MGNANVLVVVNGAEDYVLTYRASSDGGLTWTASAILAVPFRSRWSRLLGRATYGTISLWNWLHWRRILFYGVLLSAKSNLYVESKARLAMSIPKSHIPPGSLCDSLTTSVTELTKRSSSASLTMSGGDSFSTFKLCPAT